MVGMVPSIFVLIATWLIPASAVGGLGATEAGRLCDTAWTSKALLL